MIPLLAAQQCSARDGKRQNKWHLAYQIG